MNNPLDMSGRVVIVTGGAKGVGKGISERFLEAGADGIICGQSSPELLSEAGGTSAVFKSVDVKDLVLMRAAQALEAGCDGVISSGLEAAAIRDRVGPELLIVSPGIRPAGSTSIDDQKRIVTPARAFENGADYIVVGRPIRNAESPRVG